MLSVWETKDEGKLQRLAAIQRFKCSPGCSSHGVFPPEGAGRFGLQRCGTGRVSTTKSGRDPYWAVLSRTRLAVLLRWGTEIYEHYGHIVIKPFNYRVIYRLKVHMSRPYIYICIKIYIYISTVWAFYDSSMFQWLSTHHLKLNWDGTEQLFLPGKASSIHDLSDKYGHLCGACNSDGEAPRYNTWGRLPFAAHMNLKTCSCRSMLFNVRWMVKPEGHAGFGPDSCYLTPSLL